MTNHFERLAELLELESNAEAHEVMERARSQPVSQAEAAGLSLVDLVLRESYPGLGGRMLWTLGKRDLNRELPWSRLSSGSPILLSVQGARRDDGERGIVVERHRRQIRVAFNEPPDEPESGSLLRLDIAPDEAARQRQREALQHAAQARKDRLAELRGVLLGQRPAEFNPLIPAKPEEILDCGLNSSQLSTIDFALSAKDVAILHGPPGTGKTTTIVELIRRAVRRGERVLVCAPSNLAVDNVLERLVAGNEHAVRLGHPARVMESLHERTLDIMAEKHDDAKLARKLTKEAFALFRQAGKWTRAKPEAGAKQQLRQEARGLLADARKLERQAIERILQQTPILCATLTGLDPDLLGDRRFDLLVIDEACQATEPPCWIALARADRVIFAGDHCQLPPTILSTEAKRKRFDLSLHERLINLTGDAITRRLDVQYRMHEAIMNFSSHEFYHGTLQADPSVATHRLCDLPGVALSPLTSQPFQLIDTAGAGYDESLEPDGESRRNEQEAELAAQKVREMLAAGLLAEQIAVIAPYSAQVRLLRRLLGDIEGLEIDSVDGFQGREKEAVILTLVRSNTEGDIGFLRETRRTNVALTRARRCLIVIGDSATLANDPFYARLWEYAEQVGGYRTVWDA
jgi:superfamily I DNA and/or RNA helicase